MSNNNLSRVNQYLFTPNQIKSNFGLIQQENVSQDSINDDSIIDVPSQLKEALQFFWRRLNPNVKGKLKPGSRQSSTLIELNKKLHLFGGLSHTLLNDHYILKTVQESCIKKSQKSMQNNLDKQTQDRRTHLQMKSSLQKDWQWLTVQIKDQEQKKQSLSLNLQPISSLIARCGHSASPLDVKCQGIFIEGRRNHIGTIWGNKFFIFGGISSSGENLNSTAMLDIYQTKTWRQINIVNPSKGLGAIAFSASSIVDPKSQGNEHQINKISQSYRLEKIQTRGIYFFGGLRSDGKASNILLVLRKHCQKSYPQFKQKQSKNLRIGNKSLFKEKGGQKFQWYKPLVLGRGPPPRFGHCLIFIQPKRSNKSYLVVSGGRNDTRDNQDATTALNGMKCLDDLWVLDLTPKVVQNQDQLINFKGQEYQFLQKIKKKQNSGIWVITPPIWIRVSCYGSFPQPRHSFCAAELNGNLIVFGGIGEKTLCPSQVYSLETQTLTVKYLKHQFLRHVQATSGIDNSVVQKSNLLEQDNSFDTFDWIDLQFSPQTTIRKNNKPVLKNELFKNSLKQIVNKAFFQGDKKSNGKSSSIVKSMIIRKKLQDKLQTQKAENEESCLNLDKTLIQNNTITSKFSRSPTGIISLNACSLSPITKKNVSKLAINKSSSLYGIEQMQSNQITTYKRASNEFRRQTKLASFASKICNLDQSSEDRVSRNISIFD